MVLTILMQRFWWLTSRSDALKLRARVRARISAKCPHKR